MSQKIDLPGGGWAELYDADELTERQRRTVRRHHRLAIGLTARLMEKGLDVAKPETYGVYEELDATESGPVDTYNDALIATWLKSWSLDRGLPTVETAGDLPGPIYDAIAKAADNLTGDRAIDFEFSPEAAADPKADGGASTSSASSSEATSSPQE